MAKLVKHIAESLPSDHRYITPISTTFYDLEEDIKRCGRLEYIDFYDYMYAAYNKATIYLKAEEKYNTYYYGYVDFSHYTKDVGIKQINILLCCFPQKREQLVRFALSLGYYELLKQQDIKLQNKIMVEVLGSKNG